MSLQIDPTSVHLGKNAGGSIDNIYDSSYVAAPEATGRCEIPDAVVYIPGNPALLPLQPSCTFNFTDILEIPPIPPPPYPVIFRACESLVASTNIVTSDAAKNTSLSLVTSGPTISTSGSADCTLQLVGVIDIAACSDFKATSAVTFANAASSSNLAITASSIPNCGFNLTGRIDVAACESFTATSSINYGGALKGSSLALISRGIPNCGVDISGSLNVDACESFTASSAVSITGSAVKKNLFAVTSSSSPNCGFTLTGDIVIDACTSFSASGGINFRGSAVTSQSVQLIPAPQPECGLVLSGEVVIDACASFSAVNNLRINGSSVTTNRPISLTSLGTPFCGFSLDGDLTIDSSCSYIDIIQDPDAPSSISLWTNVPSGFPATAGDIFSSQPIIIRSSVVQQSGCDTVIALSIDPIDLTIPSLSVSISSFTPGTMSGCVWDENKDGPRLAVDSETGDLYIGGTLPVPCFTCETGGTSNPFVIADLELNSLKVNFIYSNPKCCKDESVNQINLCQGIIDFARTSGTMPRLTASAEEMQLIVGGTATSVTSVRAGTISLAEPYRRGTLNSGSLLLEDISAIKDTYSYITPTYVYLTDPSSSEGTLDATSLYFNTPNGARSSTWSGGFSAVNAGGAYAGVEPDIIYINQGNDEGVFAQMTPTSLYTTDGDYFARYGHDKMYISDGASFQTRIDHNTVTVFEGATEYGEMTPKRIGMVADNAWCGMSVGGTITNSAGEGNNQVDIGQDYLWVNAPRPNRDNNGYLPGGGNGGSVFLNADGVKVAPANARFPYTQVAKAYIELATSEGDYTQLFAYGGLVVGADSLYETKFDFSTAVGLNYLKLTQVAICVDGVQKPAWVFMQ